MALRQIKPSEVKDTLKNSHHVVIKGGIPFTDAPLAFTPEREKTEQEQIDELDTRVKDVETRR